MERSIRNAVLADIDDLIELRSILLDSSFEHYAAKNEKDRVAWRNAYKMWLRKYIGHHEEVNIIVMSINSTIVACVIGIIDNRAPMIGCLNGRVGWIQTMVVKEESRKQGLGQKMMEKLLVWFKKNKINKVLLQTTSIAESLYTRLGFLSINENTLMKEI